MGLSKTRIGSARKIPGRFRLIKVRGWIGLWALALACSSKAGPATTGPIGPPAPTAPTTPPTQPTTNEPVSVTPDAGVPDASTSRAAAPDTGMPDPDEPPEPAVAEPSEEKLKSRLAPKPLKGRSITLGNKQSKGLAGITFAYEEGGHGSRVDGGWGADARFKAKRGGKLEEFGFMYGSESPGDLVEVIAFGQAFEITWAGGGMKLTHIGKARREDDPGCFEAVEREAKAMGLIVAPKEKSQGMGGMGGSGVMTSRKYQHWSVHCAEQSQRVWISRKQPRMRR